MNWHDLTHGWHAVVFAWLMVAVSMWVGLALGRAPAKQWRSSPFTATFLLIVAAILIAIVQWLTKAPADLDGSVLGQAAAIGCYVLTGYLGGRFSAYSVSNDSHKRGSLVEDRAGARARHRQAGALTLAGVAVAPQDETKHFKLIGTTGTGKSTAIRELLAGALERGDRAVIADPDGGYSERFYNRVRGDVILNPFDERSVKWDLFAEIREPYDVEQLAGALIASGGDSAGREWRGYARTFLAAILKRCHQTGQRDLVELWRLLLVASSEELRPLVAGTPAQPFLEPDNGKMFGSIRSVTGSAIAALEYIQTQRATAFSVREWIRTGGRGVLFVPYRAGQIAALRVIIATWLRLAIFEAMNGAEADQRLWFIVDELDAIGPIEGLKDALARLRKFGGRCVLGFQSIAQVSSTYPAGEAQTIVENCGNTLILRCSSSEGGGTSRFASHLIGEREILRRQHSEGHSSSGIFARHTSSDSTNLTEQHVTEAAVMASEIEQLPDLAGFLKLASSPTWLRVVLKPGSSP